MTGAPGATTRAPAWVELVDGRRMPRRLAGHPALELCNTLGNCANPTEDSDYLVDFAALGTWARREGLLDDALLEVAAEAARADPGAAHRDLDRVREFRVALWHTLVEPTRQAREEVSAGVEAATRELRLDLTDAPRFTFSPSLGTRLPLLAVAWHAADLLTSPDRHHVRRCEGRDCGWLFLDAAGRRRWCLMAGCGNRAKARRFAQRQRGARPRHHPRG